MFLAGTSPVTGIMHGSYQGNGAPEVFSTREVAYKSMVPRSHLKKSEGLNWFNFMTTQCSALHDWNELGSCLPYHKKVSECL